jgi:hypothetical protein
MNAQLAAIEAEIDRDLTAFHADLARTIATALAKPKPNLATLGHTLEDLILARYGASVGEAPVSALGRYLEAQVARAFMVGYGKDLPGYAIDWARTGPALVQAGRDLTRMLRANLAALAAAKRGEFTAGDASAFLGNFLTVQGAAVPMVGKGSHGLYLIRRLMYREVLDAHGLGARARAKVDGRGVRWVLSPLHPKRDHCDTNAERDVGYGPGVYPPEEVPDYPDHDHCMCHLEPVDLEAA